jgi:hypothetical protein
MKVGRKAEEILAAKVGLAVTAHSLVSHNWVLVPRLVKGTNREKPVCAGLPYFRHHNGHFWLSSILLDVVETELSAVCLPGAPSKVPQKWTPHCLG